MIHKCAFITLSLFLMAMGRPQEAPVASAPQPQPGSGSTPIPIISQTESIEANGNFKYSYETGNGIKFEETGVLKHVTGLRARGNFAADDNTPDEDDILVQTGSFSYTAPDGTVITLSYVADENGFQPVGDHLPTPPPIPADILRSLPQAGEQPQQPQQPPAQKQQVQQQQPVQQQPQEQPQQEAQQEAQQEPAEATHTEVTTTP